MTVTFDGADGPLLDHIDVHVEAGSEVEVELIKKLANSMNRGFIQKL